MASTESTKYTITKHTKEQAKKLGVTVKPSENKKKKIDVFKKGEKVASVGAKSYGDFGTFKKEEGSEFAKKRREAYKARHEKTRKKTGTNSWWADKLLW